MKIQKLACPDCNAPINYDRNNPISFCPYCGTALYFDDETKRIEINYKDERVIRDEARIIEAENRREELRQDAEYEKPIYYVIIFAAIPLFMLFFKWIVGS